MTRIIIATERSRPPAAKAQTKPTRNKSKCCTLISYSLLPLLLLLLAGAVLLCVFLPSRDEDEHSPTRNNSNVQAILIAGSRGFNNYRHQADVALTYHLLLSKGVPKENIITMMFDDIARHPDNPHKGELRSSPLGPNLYENLRIDYKGDDVNIHVLTSVLLGDSLAVALKGTRRVLKNTLNRNLFLYYSDHGHGGILGMPSGDFLTKKKLRNIISSVMFNGMTIYIEACQAAQMVGDYENDKRISALVASTAYESSYAANCRAGICYSDEFTLVWTNDTLKHDIRKHTLGYQYKNVKNYLRTSKACSFGSSSLEQDWVQNYQGGGRGLRFTQPSVNKVSNLVSADQGKLSTLEKSFADESATLSIPSIDIAIYSAQWKLKLAKSSEEKIRAQQELDDIVSGRILAENLISDISTKMNGTLSLSGEKNAEDSDCFERVLEEFSKKCYALGTNTYFTRIISQLKKYAGEENCDSIIEVITNKCSVLKRANGFFII